MDERLRRLWELYGEDGASSSDDQPSDPAIDDEGTGWMELKALLEARPRRSPRPEAVEAILLAARSATLESRAADRSAVRRRGAGFRRLAVAGVVTAALAGAWFVFQPLVSDAPVAPPTEDVQVAETGDVPLTEMPQVAATEDASDRPTVIATIERPEIDRRASGTLRTAAVNPVPAAEEPDEEGDGLFLVEEDLDWDQSDEVREIYDHVAELYLVSPQGSHWRNASRPEVLTAPVGLVRPQQAAFYTGP